MEYEEKRETEINELEDELKELLTDPNPQSPIPI